MNNIFLISVFMALTTPVVSAIEINPKSVTVQECFEPCDIIKSLPLSPSTDLVSLEKQIKANPDQWKAAVDFLTKSDLIKLADGRHEITSDGVYANVQEYQTKVEANYECHRKYIDIQCVVSGEEHIYVADIAEVSNPVAEFDCKKDIQFFCNAAQFTKVLADKDNYVILFPKDAHKPCMNIDGKHSQIRKVVVKIPMK